MSAPLDLAYPFTGRWLVQNSPANGVPSHGTRLFATDYAIDFVPVDENGRTAPITLTSLLRTQPPDDFPGFGRPLVAPVDGVVIAAHGNEPHVHVQAVDNADVDRAGPVRISFRGSLPANGEVIDIPVAQ